MAYIDLGSDEDKLPGITGLFAFRPETAKPFNELTEILLRGENSLSRGEREMIAAYVSGLNDCNFCSNAHSAFAAAQLDEGMPLVMQVRTNPALAPITPKLRALLSIAAAVRESGLKVTAELIDAARAEGATDVEIHDAVMIAALFSMANRYVDGLGTLAPDDPEGYAMVAQGVVANGYSTLGG